jgi:hypothetical protein
MIEKVPQHSIASASTHNAADTLILFAISYSCTAWRATVMFCIQW